MKIKCPNAGCTARIDVDDSFCATCGKAVNHSIACIKCGAAHDPNERFCSACGHDQTLTEKKTSGYIKKGKWEKEDGEIARLVSAEDMQPNSGVLWDSPNKLRVPKGCLAFIVENGSVKFVRPPGMKKVVKVQQESAWKKLWHWLCVYETKEDQNLPEVDDCEVYFVDDCLVPISFKVQVSSKRKESGGTELVQVVSTLKMNIGMGDSKSKENNRFYKSLLKGKSSLHMRDIQKQFRPLLERVAKKKLENFGNKGHDDYSQCEADIEKALEKELTKSGLSIELTIVPEGKLGSHNLLLGAAKVPVLTKCTNTEYVRVRNCASCNTPMSEDDAFCGSCGNDTVVEQRGCIADLATGEMYCHVCGAKQVHSQDSNVNSTANNISLLTADKPPQRVEFDLVLSFKGAFNLTDKQEEKIKTSMLGECAHFVRTEKYQDLQSTSKLQQLSGLLEKSHQTIFRGLGLQLLNVVVLDVRSKDGDWVLGARADMGLIEQQLKIAREWDDIRELERDYQIDRDDKRLDHEDEMAEHQFERGRARTAASNDREITRDKDNFVHEMRVNEQNLSHDEQRLDLDAEIAVFALKEMKQRQENLIKKTRFRLESELELFIVTSEGELKQQNAEQDAALRKQKQDNVAKKGARQEDLRDAIDTRRDNLDHKITNANMDVEETSAAQGIDEQLQENLLAHNFTMEELRIVHRDKLEEFELNQEEMRELRFQERTFRMEEQEVQLREKRQSHRKRNAEMDIADAKLDSKVVIETDKATREARTHLRTEDQKERIDVLKEEIEYDDLVIDTGRKRKKGDREFQQGEEVEVFDHQAGMEHRTLDHDASIVEHGRTEEAKEDQFKRDEQKKARDFEREEEGIDSTHKYSEQTKTIDHELISEKKIKSHESDMKDVDRETAVKDRDFDSESTRMGVDDEQYVAKNRIDTEMYGEEKRQDFKERTTEFEQGMHERKSTFDETQRRESLKFETDLVQDTADREVDRNERTKQSQFDREELRFANEHDREMGKEQMHNEHELKRDGTYSEREGTYEQRADTDLKKSQMGNDHEALMADKKNSFMIEGMKHQQEMERIDGDREIRGKEIDADVSKADIDKDKAIGLAQTDASVKIAEANANVEARVAEEQAEASRKMQEMEQAERAKAETEMRRREEQVREDAERRRQEDVERAERERQEQRYREERDRHERRADKDDFKDMFQQMMSMQSKQAEIQADVAKTQATATAQSNAAVLGAMTGQQSQNQQKLDQANQNALEQAQRGSDIARDMAKESIQAQAQNVQAVAGNVVTSNQAVQDARKETVQTAVDAASNTVNAVTNVAGARANNTSAFGGGPSAPSTPPPRHAAPVEESYHYNEEGVQPVTRILELITANPHAAHQLWADGWNGWKSWRDVPSIANRVKLPESSPPPSGPAQPAPQSNRGAMGFVVGDDAAKSTDTPTAQAPQLATDCISCGAKLKSPGAPFCTKCGTKQR